MSADFVAWLDAAVERLRSRPDVVGVVAMGSTADLSRVDEWSDHDIAIVVEEGAERRYRGWTGWMPDADQVVLCVQEWHQGVKALFADGRKVEWGVATVASLATWLADDARVLWDRGGVAAAVAAAQAAPFPANDAELETDIASLLLAIHHGMSRLRRGEVLSGGETIRSEASGALLRAIRAGVPSERAGVLDRLDGRRRFEVAYPDLAADVARALDLAPEPAARRLLDIAVREFGAVVPPAAIDAIKRRFGWC